MRSDNAASVRVPIGQSEPELLRDIAAKRQAVRTCERLLEVARAQAEATAIDAKGGDSKALGANEADRKRALLLLIEEDLNYRTFGAQLLVYQGELDRLQAEAEILRLARRDRETEALDRLSAALAGYSGLGDVVLNGRTRS